jgi:hypothetical protein
MLSSLSRFWILCRYEVIEMPIPKPLSLNLSEAERAQLEKLIKQYTVAQQIALRARIVLAAAAPLTANETAA